MGEGIFDKMKYLIGIEEVEADELELSKDAKKTERDYAKSIPMVQTKDNKVVNFQQKPQMRLVVHEPASFDECPKIVDNLKNKKPVIVNLEKVDTDVAKRIFDFISGSTYALDGSVQKVANNIFVFAPDNVDISSNVDLKSFEGSTKSGIWK